MQKAPSVPPFPARLTYLWRDFCDIVAGMEGNGWGPPVITWQGLSAWCKMTGAQLAPWEARLLIRLGSLRARILSEASSERSDKDRANR